MTRKNTEKLATAFISFLILGSILYSCAKKEPEWVRKGSGAFPQEQKIYGVGVANQTPSEAMDRTRCDTRARAELAKILNTYVASLVTDFMENNRDFFNPEKEGLDEFTQSIIKTVTEATLVGSQIIDRYIDEKKKIHYCLAALEINNALMNLADKMREAARQQHRALVKERSDEMLKKLDEELKKKTERGF
ncbi:MAG: LPP20 family lipoprotein [Candidatus Calescibacterium sp.]|nr:LPP20 family lipoprotein [Candidatus Calescibacterium sp.]MCX7733967.1 LPP20 family lipoprotein [bacterium]MDW8086434.1 LPP20 family lipoprotein [Candidatus Calescibacterium sp.]